MTSWVPFDLLDHLWQSTLFTAAVWLAARALRANGARVRYWLWFAASMKFLIPLSLLVNAGERFAWRTDPVAAPPVVPFVIDQVLTPAGSAWSSTGRLAETVPLGEPVAAPATIMSWLLLAAWAAGVTFVLLSWWRQWLSFRRARADAQAIHLNVEYDADGLTIMASPSMIEPGVFGIRRPILLVPTGISDRLAPAQLRALIAHEHCHVRHRDNLTAALHMAVEAIFWFHPVVWWIERRLIDERERACDEHVLQSGSTPHDYADGILAVCRLATEPPPAFVAGVSGSDLKRRIRSILRQESGRPLGVLRAGALCACCAAAGVGPVVLGAVNTPAQLPAGITAAAFEAAGIRTNPAGAETSTFNPRPSRAGVGPPRFGAAQVRPEFEVAAIRPADQPLSGEFVLGLNAKGVQVRIAWASLMDLVNMAYGVKRYQISGPSWLGTDHFYVDAKIPDGFTTRHVPAMLQRLLDTRFAMKSHWEKRERPVYTLGLSGATPNLTEVAAPENQLSFPIGNINGARAVIDFGDGGTFTFGDNRLEARKLHLDQFTEWFSNFMDRPVINSTGLTGYYDFQLKLTPRDFQTMWLWAVAAGSGADVSPAALGVDALALESLPNALKNLGFKLERGKGLIDVIVVDAVERKPTAN